MAPSSDRPGRGRRDAAEHWRRLLALLACCSALGTSAAGRAQGDADAYAVPQEAPIALRALVDLRVVRGSEAPSWQEGGPGKLRYGGLQSSTGSLERVTRLAISQFALEPSAVLPWDLRFQAQVNWDGDVDNHGNTSPDHDVVRLVEGYVRKEWGGGAGGWGLLAGVTNPSFSLENDGPAWTPKDTLSPSALNSWLWEEGRILGFEGEWWRTTAAGVALDASAGMGWGPDQQGVLLARRGWVLSDFLSGINSRLPLPGGESTDVFDERDGRPALYVGGSVGDPWKIGTLHVGYFDNLGNLAVAGVWETRYAVAGVAMQPLPGLDLLFQYLIGKTASRGEGISSSVQALYPLVSYRWRAHRISFRYDDFRVQDEHGPPVTRERGHAFTVAYLFEFWMRHRVGFEYVTVSSDRIDGPRNPGDDGWQISYRYRY